MKIDYVNPLQVFKNAKDYIPERILSNGRRVIEFEEKAAEYLGSRYAVATSSCTIALFCIWEVLGISGKKVLLPSYTWRSTADAIRMAGGIPVFGEVDTTLCLSRKKCYKTECIIETCVEAVCVTEAFGCPARYEDLEKLTVPYVIDAAHSFGSLYRGEKIGKYGIHAFSLSPTKVLISNEGGLITCNDVNLANELKDVRRWAGRMSEYNAACALEGLKTLSDTIFEKQKIARRYRDFAQSVGWQIQEINPNNSSTFKDVIFILKSEDERDKLKVHLENAGIETKIYFVPAHTIKQYRNSESMNLDFTSHLFHSSLCIPSWVGIDQDYVMTELQKFVERKEP